MCVYVCCVGERVSSFDDIRTFVHMHWAHTLFDGEVAADDGITFQWRYAAIDQFCVQGFRLKMITRYNTFNFCEIFEWRRTFENVPEQMWIIFVDKKINNKKNDFDRTTIL